MLWMLTELRVWAIHDDTGGDMMRRCLKANIPRLNMFILFGTVGVELTAPQKKKTV